MALLPGSPAIDAGSVALAEQANLQTDQRGTGYPRINPANNTGRISYEIGELDAYGGHCGLGDDYHYHVAPVHLTPVLGNVDVGVVPVYDDRFTRYMLPVKLLEYAALGIPAICSSTQTIRRYFDDTMVRFVRPGDVEDLAAAIVELGADSELRKRLELGARRFNEQHGWEAERARYYELIDSLISKPSRVSSARGMDVEK